MPLTDSEEVAQLQRISRAAAPDAAQLSHTLRRACRLLGGQCHQQADNVVGVLVAANASRLLPTAWPILFQIMRDTDDIKVKLTILKHVAHLADRIAAQQHVNAFRVFSTEALPLLASVEVVIDSTFLRSFTYVLEALGLSAEAEQCRPLLATLTDHLASWTRPDALRAAANLAVAVVALTDACGSLEDFLATAKNVFAPLAFAFVLDSSLSFVAKRRSLARFASLDGVQRLIASVVAETFLAQGGANTPTSVLPSVVASFCRLRESSSPVSWTIPEEVAVCRRVLHLLKDSSTKKAFVTPLLRFLQVTHVRWWKKRRPVLQLASTADALTRSEALTSLAHGAQFTDADAAAEAVGQLLPHFSRFVTENCASTVSGILKCLAVLLPKLRAGQPLHKTTCQRLLLAFTAPAETKVTRNTAVQVCFLRVLMTFDGDVSPAAVSYVKSRLTDERASVRRAALETLLYWCERYSLQLLDFARTPMRAVDFFEGSFRQNSSAAATAFFDNMSGFAVMQNYGCVFAFLLAQLTERPVPRSETDFSSSLADSCENLLGFFDLVSHRIASVDGSLGVVATTVPFMNAFLCDALTAGLVSSVDTFSKVASLLTVSLEQLSLSSLSSSEFSVFEHKDLVSFVCSILFLCCECVDPNAFSAVPLGEAVYFSKVQLSGSVTKMVRLTAEASLTNQQPLKESSFFHFVDDNLTLLTRLIETGATSPLFVTHLRNAYMPLIVCADTLAGSNPNCALRLFCAIGRILLGVETQPAIERVCLPFINAVNCVLMRALQFDLTQVGADLFCFATLVVRCDSTFSTASCYTTFDPRGGLLEQAVRFLSWGAGYKKGASTHESALAFLLALLRSPKHRRLAQKHCTKLALEKVKRVLSDSKPLLGVSTLRRCQETLGEVENLATFQHSENDAKGRDGDALADGCLPNVGAEELSDPDGFFLFLEKFCESFSGQSQEEIRFALAGCHLFSNNETRAPLSICLAAVDPAAIPFATETVLAAICEDTAPPFLVDVLVALMAYTPSHARCHEIAVPDRISAKRKAHELLSAYQQGLRGERATRQRTVAENTNARSGREVHGQKEQEELEKSRSTSFHIGCDEVSAALKQMVTGACALSLAPSQLLTEGALDRTVLADVFECSQAAAAFELLGILIEENNVHLIDARCTIALAQSLVMRRGGDDGDDEESCPGPSLPMDERTAAVLQRQFHKVLLQQEKEKNSEEFVLVLKYSVLVLLWHLLPEELDATATVFEIVKRCCGAPSTVSSVEELAQSVRSLIGAASSWRADGSAFEVSILWLAARFCGRALWSGLAAAPTGAPQDALADLRFFCQAAHTVGIPSDLWGAVHARCEPLLVDYGVNSEDANLDEQRAAFWLTAALILEVPWAGGHVAKPMLHTSLSECLPLYNDFPLHSLESTASRTVRQLGLQALLPFYKRRPQHRRTLNLHLCSLLVPLGNRRGCREGHSSESAPAAASSLLHTLGHVMERAMPNADAWLPSCVCDVMSAVALVSVGNTSFVRFASALTADPLSSRVVHLAQRWLLSYGADWLEDPLPTQQPRSVVENHVGLFPGATVSLGFHDITAITAVSVMLSCFSPSLDAPAAGARASPEMSVPLARAREVHADPFSAPPQAVVGSGSTAVATAAATPPPPHAAAGAPSPPLPDIVAILNRMLCTDVFLYTTALSSVVVLSAASRRHEVSQVAAFLSHRIHDDLSRGHWGLLSIPFALMQLLRASCAVLTMIPEEKTSTKVFEGVWGSLLRQTWSPALTAYGHYIIQCLAQIAPLGEGRQRRQWEMLRTLVMGTRPTRSVGAATTAATALPLWSVGYCETTQQRRNLLAPHQSTPRPVSLSWSEGVAAAGPSGERAQMVSQLRRRFLNQQELLTRATLALRSISRSAGASDAAAAEEERDRSRVQVVALTEAIASSSLSVPTLPTCAELLCLEALTESTMTARDTFFSAINRFNFSVASRRTVLHEFARILHSQEAESHTQRGDNTRVVVCDAVLGFLSMFFEAVSRRVSCEEHSWWLVVVLLDALLSAMSTAVSCALLSAVVVPQPASQLKELALAIASFCRSTPLCATAVSFFASLRSGATAAAATTPTTTTAALTAVLLALNSSE